jgi:hypothetical protein
MFDPGITHLIDGPKIDSPLNALTLTLEFHRLYFEPTGRPYEYKIDSVEQILRDMEQVAVKADGSTNLGDMMTLRLDDWVQQLVVF